VLRGWFGVWVFSLATLSGVGSRILYSCLGG